MGTECDCDAHEYVVCCAGDVLFLCWTEQIAQCYKSHNGYELRVQPIDFRAISKKVHHEEGYPDALKILVSAVQFRPRAPFNYLDLQHKIEGSRYRLEPFIFCKAILEQ